MEQGHAANARRKAEQAVEIIETVLIPRLDIAGVTHHAALAGAYRLLFQDCDETAWATLGTLYKDATGRSDRFDTSRPIIKSVLERRMAETDTRQGDPFDVFASNQSGKN